MLAKNRAPVLNSNLNWRVTCPSDWYRTDIFIGHMFLDCFPFISTFDGFIWFPNDSSIMSSFSTIYFYGLLSVMKYSIILFLFISKIHIKTPIIPSYKYLLDVGDFCPQKSYKKRNKWIKITIYKTH